MEVLRALIFPAMAVGAITNVAVFKFLRFILTAADRWIGCGWFLQIVVYAQ
jgi:hypothetical protein